MTELKTLADSTHQILEECKLLPHTSGTRLRNSTSLLLHRSFRPWLKAVCIPHNTAHHCMALAEATDTIQAKIVANSTRRSDSE